MIKGAYTPGRIIVTEDDEADPFLMNTRAVDRTMYRVTGPLQRLEKALAESDRESAAHIAAALKSLELVAEKHHVLDNCDEWWGRRSEFWTDTMQRYHDRFRDVPALLYWKGTPADLDQLMEAALARGRRVSVREVFDLQGNVPPLAALI